LHFFKRDRCGYHALRGSTALVAMLGVAFMSFSAQLFAQDANSARLWGSSPTRRSDFILHRRIHRQSSHQPEVVKKQQMRWQPETAHLLLQVRTRTLNGKLRETFQRWWPAMTPASAPALS
jgi:hypothetical protein